MNDTILTILTVVTSGIIIIGIIGYMLTTRKIIDEQEKEILSLKKQLAFRDDLDKHSESLQIIKAGEDFEDYTDFKFGGF